MPPVPTAMLARTVAPVGDLMPTVAFLADEPADPATNHAFKTLVAGPCELALRRTYGELVATNSLEQLFHYRPVS